jgi:hypothetical protein
MPIEQTRVQDLSYSDYTRRQEEEVSVAGISKRAATAKRAGNFHYQGNKWIPREYKGVAVLSMVDTNSGNEGLPFRLSALQDELRAYLPPPAYYMLPVASFHQTVANMVSAERYRVTILDGGLEKEYPAIVGAAFAQLPSPVTAPPVSMRLLGISIFGTALGLLGSFEKEEDYDRIIRFRSLLYGNHRLAALDIGITRPFIGHITLAYIEQELSGVEREHLARVVNGINERIRPKNYSFALSTTGLYRYDHLAAFYREDSWPRYQL